MVFLVAFTSAIAPEQLGIIFDNSFGTYAATRYIEVIMRYVVATHPTYRGYA